ncbi:MAG: 3'-5' exoribonuclease YhaM family protein [Rhodanobacteraceae bacterium]
MNLFDEVERARQGVGKSAGGKPAGRGGKPETAESAGATGVTGAAKSLFIADFKAGTVIDETFYCTDAAVRLGARSKYLHAQLVDRSGSIVCRMWDVDDAVLAHISQGSYVRVQAAVETYQDKPQLVIRKVRKLDPSEVLAGEYLPCSKFDADKMADEFWALIKQLPAGEYKTAIEAVFSNEVIWPRFRLAPAASMNHHAWIHGLLEHTLNIMRSVALYEQVHPELKLDMVMAGVAFHDIGKAWELEAQPGLSYTDEGMLLGHINIGFMVVDTVLREVPAVSAKARMMIGHMILSHHGTREFGSPVTPMFPEAIAVHHLECLDAKLQGVRTAMDNADPNLHWTPKVMMADGNRVFKDY